MKIVNRALGAGLCAFGLMGCVLPGGKGDSANRPERSPRDDRRIDQPYDGGHDRYGEHRDDRYARDRDRDDRDRDRYGTRQEEIGYSSADEQFLVQMTSRHLASLELLDIANGKVRHPELQALVETMRNKQQGEVDQMRAMRNRAGPPQVDQPSSITRGDVTRLRNHRPGDTFDLVFMDMMMPLQEEAIRLSQEFADKAEGHRTKDFARGILQENRYELGQLQQWKAAWSQGRPGYDHDDDAWHHRR